MAKIEIPRSTHPARLVSLRTAVVSTDPTSSTALEFAAAFLAVILEGGPIRWRRVTTRAANAGISLRTLRRAREQLGVKPRKTAIGRTVGTGVGQMTNEGVTIDLLGMTALS